MKKITFNIKNMPEEFNVYKIYKCVKKLSVFAPRHSDLFTAGEYYPVIYYNNMFNFIDNEVDFENPYTRVPEEPDMSNNDFNYEFVEVDFRRKQNTLSLILMEYDPNSIITELV